jgi:hypothetical protein
MCVFATTRKPHSGGQRARVQTWAGSGVASNGKHENNQGCGCVVGCYKRQTRGIRPRRRVHGFVGMQTRRSELTPIRSLPRAVGKPGLRTETDGCRHPAAGMCEAGTGAWTAKPFTRNLRPFGPWCAPTCDGGDRDTRHYLRRLAFTPRCWGHATRAHHLHSSIAS